MSGNLGITPVAASQNQKEVTVNAALLRLDAAITETFDADVTSGNVTLTTAQYQQAIQVRAINATTSGRTVTLPAVERITILRNDPANTQSVGFVRGSTTLTIAVGETVLARTDGTTNGLVALLRGSGTGGSSGVTLEDEGSTVTGGPHTTLNFVGAGVAVTNAGGGEATVTISGGGGGGSADSITKCVKSANQSISNATWTLVTWNAEIFDDNGAHDNATNNSRITVPSGFTRVRLTAMINWANNVTAGRLVEIKQNAAGVQSGGTSIAADLRTAKNETTQHADSGWLSVTSGDYFEVFVNQDSGSAVNLIGPVAFGGRSFFQAEFRA